MSDWTDRTKSMVYIGPGRNGVANPYCDEHGWIQTDTSWEGERPWTEVSAAVAAHLAESHPNLPPDGRTGDDEGVNE